MHVDPLGADHYLPNILPSYITVEEFERELNRYVTSKPDEPLIPGYTAMRRTDSNSLLDMIPIS